MAGFSVYRGFGKMSRYAAFMAGNARKTKNKRVVISKRMTDPQTGQPAEWEIRLLTAGENEEIQRRCMVNVPVPGQNGVYDRQLDHQSYVGEMAAACVVHPELNDAELQDSYGVKSARALLWAMLEPKEYLLLVSEVTALGAMETLGSLVDEAKN